MGVLNSFFVRGVGNSTIKKLPGVLPGAGGMVRLGIDRYKIMKAHLSLLHW